MRNRGIASIAVIVLVVIIAAILGAIFYYRHLAVAPTLPAATEPPGQTSSTSPTTATTTSTSSPTATTTGLSPQRGPVGTLVTIHGSGFGPDNAIEMNNLAGSEMRDVASPDGKTLTFRIPTTLGPVCKSEICAQFLLEVTPNDYKVSVVTGSSTEDIGTFTVTSSTTNPTL